MRDDEQNLLRDGAGFGKGYDRPPGLTERLGQRVGLRAKRLGQRVLRAIFGAIGLAASLGERPHPAPRRILVIRTDLLGDLVLTLPAVLALRRAYPEAQIDLLVQPSTAGILAGQPGIDRVLLCDPDGWFGGIGKREIRAKLRDLVRTLRAARYDLAVSICGDAASIFARLSGARRRVGYAGEAFAHFLTDPVPGARYQIRQHETAYCLDLAAAAGGIVDPPGSLSRLPRLMVLPEAQAVVADLLAQSGARPRQPVIALHAGARNGQAKRWPLPYWARLADQLMDQTDALVVLIGAPGDKPLAQGVIQRLRVPARAVDLTGATDLPALVALLAACAVVVTGDSGPLHIAEAVGTRVVAIHGPTDPVQSGPCHPESIVLRRDLWCSPCYDSRATAECRFSNPICMKHLLPAEVLPAVLAQLQATRMARASGEGSPG